MELYQITLVPIAFGLLGFVEPCSIGANIIFLGYLQARERAKVLEAVKFTVTRALFLGLVGLAAGVLGQSLRIGTYSYSMALGFLYTFLGFFSLWWGYRGIGLAPLNLGRYFSKGGAVPLGVIFGLSAPACSLPLLLALVGLGAMRGAWVGFLTLFLFGLALSAPLLCIARSERADEILRRLGRVAVRVRYLPGLVLIFVGAVTILIAWQQLVRV
ncbi:MAG: hypothetical protein ACE5JU_01780 [Candidatus Binatia bacterium]